MQVTLKVGGMSCGNCVKHVKSALAAVPGIAESQVEVGKVVVTLAEGTTAQAVKEAIEEEGYQVLSIA